MDGRLSLDGAIYRAPYGANKIHTHKYGEGLVQAVVLQGLLVDEQVMRRKLIANININP